MSFKRLGKKTLVVFALSLLTTIAFAITPPTYLNIKFYNLTNNRIQLFNTKKAHTNAILKQSNGIFPSNVVSKLCKQEQATPCNLFIEVLNKQNWSRKIADLAISQPKTMGHVTTYLHHYHIKNIIDVGGNVRNLAIIHLE